jgi:hypothetical protein
VFFVSAFSLTHTVALFNYCKSSLLSARVRGLNTFNGQQCFRRSNQQFQFQHNSKVLSIDKVSRRNFFRAFVTLSRPSESEATTSILDIEDNLLPPLSPSFPQSDRKDDKFPDLITTNKPAYIATGRLKMDVKVTIVDSVQRAREVLAVLAEMGDSGDFWACDTEVLNPNTNPKPNRQCYPHLPRHFNQFLIEGWRRN